MRKERDEEKPIISFDSILIIHMLFSTLVCKLYRVETETIVLT